MIIKFDKKHAKFFCKDSINIYGDMDILMMLGMHK